MKTHRLFFVTFLLACILLGQRVWSQSCQQPQVTVTANSTSTSSPYIICGDRAAVLQAQGGYTNYVWYYNGTDMNTLAWESTTDTGEGFTLLYRPLGFMMSADRQKIKVAFQNWGSGPCCPNTTYTGNFNVKASCYGGTTLYSSTVTVIKSYQVPEITTSGSLTLNSCSSTVTLSADSGFTNYIWYKNGTTYATGQKITVSSPGRYSVTATAPYCTGSMSPKYVDVIYTGTVNSLVLQPDAAVGKDAYISNRPDLINTNFGSDYSIWAATWTYNSVLGTSRSLLQFDLSAIPAGTTLQSAELTLYGGGEHVTIGNSGDNVCYLKRVTAPWNENTVTWNNQPATTTTNAITLAASTGGIQNYVINVLPLIQDMRTSGNYGFMLQLATEETYRNLSFYSSDHTDPKLRPRLQINYCTSGGRIANLRDEKALATDDVEVYPNPFNTQVKLKLSGVEAEKINFRITNSMGKVIPVDVHALGNSTYEFGKELPSGFYIIQLGYLDKVKSIKIVKQ
jgi:hypothetical protein